MIEIGKNQTLEVLRITPPGAYLGDNEGNDVLLPTKFIPINTSVGDLLNVFVYTDSEDRIIATTQEPLVRLNEFAALRVADVNKYGAFIDWGLDKDILVPFKQQNQRMNVDEWYLIYLYLDKSTNRLVATSKVQPIFNKDFKDVAEGQKVEILIGESSDLGIQVVVDNQYRGLLYHNEVHQDLMIGDRTEAYIKKIRMDGKLDISLQETGLTHMESSAEKIMEILEEEGGYLPVGDKSSPEDIQVYFQLSKKAFKRAVGILYKQRKIEIDKNSIKISAK